MKRIVLLLSLCSLLCSGVAHAALDWYTDYAQAQAVATQENKPMLLFFTGSDWCGWCMKLQKEVFDKPEFSQLVGDKYVFVELDFPMRKAQPDAVKRTNDELANRYNVQGYPTVVLVSPTGRKLGQTGYVKGGPKAYAEHLQGMVGVAHDLDQTVDQLAQGELASLDLQRLYERALVLGQTIYADKLLEAGLKDAQATFFLAEKYRQLVRSEGLESEAALSVKETLLENDLHNQGGQHRFVAVLEFQHKVVDKSLGVEERIQPLLSYLESYGAADPERWRVETTLAQALFCWNEIDEALHYAKASLSTAPAQQRPFIERLIQQMPVSS